MSSPLKRPTPDPELHLAALLAKNLLCPSTLFEDSSVRSRTATLEGMRCLAALDGTTQRSLQASQTAGPAETPEQSATTAASTATVTAAPSVAAPQVATPSPGPTRPEPGYGSHRPEYRPGLQDRSVIDALLDYHRRKRPSIPSRLFSASSEFKPAATPPVSVAPKNSPRLSQTRPLASRIFRPRTD